MDGAGVGIGVEEAILEANEDDDVDGIMVSSLEWQWTRFVR